MAFQSFFGSCCPVKKDVINCGCKTKGKEKSMNYQLVCVDLDGTLLDENKQLPSENCLALRRVWEEGIEVCIASGRGAESAGEYLEEMGITGSVIALNGGQVVCHGKEIYRAEMRQDVIEPVIQIVEEMNLIAYFNDGKGTIAVNEGEDDLKKRLENNPRLLETYQLETPESLRKKVRSGTCPVVKISIREDDSDRLEEVRKRILERVNAQAAKSDVNYLDIFPFGQSKWTGIEKLLSWLDISAESCVCFGDNENDQEMLEQAGLGIAMGNASLDLKARADFVSLKNQECGVAYGIRTWVLGA